MYAKKKKITEEKNSNKMVNMRKAREERDNKAKPTGGFMSDCVMKKSLIEREQEEARKSKEKEAEKDIKSRRETKDIVMAFDIN